MAQKADQSAGKPAGKSSDDKAERLAQALRQNLRRRKAQSAARREPGPATSVPDQDDLNDPVDLDDHGDQADNKG